MKNVLRFVRRRAVLVPLVIVAVLALGAVVAVAATPAILDNTVPPVDHYAGACSGCHVVTPVDPTLPPVIPGDDGANEAIEAVGFDDCDDDASEDASEAVEVGGSEDCSDDAAEDADHADGRTDDAADKAKDAAEDAADKAKHASSGSGHSGGSFSAPAPDHSANDHGSSHGDHDHAESGD